LKAYREEPEEILSEVKLGVLPVLTAHVRAVTEFLYMGAQHSKTTTTHTRNINPANIRQTFVCHWVTIKTKNALH